jgi:hypothetical protein
MVQMKPTKVVGVNTRPTGEFSLTLQHIETSIIHVGKNLTMMEYDEPRLSSTLNALNACDMIICYPVAAGSVLSSYAATGKAVHT